MKRAILRRFVHIAIVGLTACGVAAADFPDPLIQVDFNGNWVSNGTAGGDLGMVVTDTLPGDPNYLAPDFGEGILSDAFDQVGLFDIPGGAVVFGDDVTPTNMQTALSGLMSFTITGFVRIDDPTLYGSTSHIGSVIFSAIGGDGDHAIGIVKNRWHGLSLVVNGVMETDRYGDDAFHWLSNYQGDHEQKWIFLSVSYDGTVDPGSDPFVVQNVVWYTGTISGQLHLRPCQNSVGNGVLYQGATNTVSGKVWFGNTADTASRFVNEGGVDVGYEVDPSNPATFAGRLEGFKIFGSTTDASGVLTQEEIMDVRESIVGGFCGSADNPFPAGDMTGDCMVDLSDFAQFSAMWMTDVRP